MVFTVFRYGMSNLTTVLAIVDVTSVDMVAGHEDMSVTKRYEVPTEEMKYIGPLKGLAQIAMRPYLRR